MSPIRASFGLTLASPLLHDCTNSAIVCESGALMIEVNTEKTLMDICVQNIKTHSQTKEREGTKKRKIDSKNMSLP